MVSSENTKCILTRNTKCVNGMILSEVRLDLNIRRIFCFKIDMLEHTVDAFIFTLSADQSTCPLSWRCHPSLTLLTI